MAIMVGKGTVLQESISSVYTTISQVISFDLPEAENEVFEADYLDNSSAGIPYMNSQRTEGGSISGEIWLDPALASFRKMTDKLVNPTTGVGTAYKVVFTTTTNVWAFNGVGVKVGGSVVLSEGIKGAFGIKLNGIVSYTTTT
jgi:hypothetical protein